MAALQPGAPAPDFSLAAHAGDPLKLSGSIRWASRARLASLRKSSTGRPTTQLFGTVTRSANA